MLFPDAPASSRQERSSLVSSPAAPADPANESSSLSLRPLLWGMVVSNQTEPPFPYLGFTLEMSLMFPDQEMDSSVPPGVLGQRQKVGGGRQCQGARTQGPERMFPGGAICD